MPRIRTIKPESSFNDELFDMEMETGWPIRFVWALLPCHCDREGRFKYEPRRLKPQILPFDDIDFSRVLHALWTRGFIEKYSENGRDYAYIPTFLDHQVVNNRESESSLPEPNKNNMLTCEERENHACLTRKPRVQQGKEGKGKEGKEGGDSNESPSLLKKPKTLKVYLLECEKNNVDAIPQDSIVFENADKLKLPHEYVLIAWEHFKEHWLENKKAAKKINWITTFNNCLKDSGYSAYQRNQSGEWYLTTKGKNTKILNGIAA